MLQPPYMHPLRFILVAVCLVSLLSTGPVHSATPGSRLRQKVALDFSNLNLPELLPSPGKTFSFEQYQEKIVVLDFFAYWCAPCARTSPILEKEIAAYYASKNGNPHGIPVDLVAVNVESANPRRTDMFIRRAGLAHVIQDLEGQLLEQFDSQGIPLIVVLDGTSSESGFVIRYQHAGFEGVEQLRSVIDAIGEKPHTDATLSAETPNDPEFDSKRNLLTEHTFETAGEALLTDDYQLTQWNMRYGHTYGRTEWDAGLMIQTFDLDMRSPDPFFTSMNVRNERILGQLRASQQINDDLTLRLQGGYYEGFQSYRALWLHEYYKQIGNLPIFAGYPEIDPRGYQLSTQARWEYLPGSGYLETGAGFYRDHIAPSAEFERITILGRDRIDSIIYRVATENVLTKRLRSLLELQLTDTTDRQLRWSLQGSLNAALSETWVMRWQTGAATENPSFNSWFTGLTLEHDLNDSWLLSFFGRFYEDTGEIQNSLPSSNAPPGLKSYHLGLGLRWIGEKSSVRVSAGPYWTRYEEANIAAPFFEDIYQNRNWGLFQAAFDMKF